MIARLTYLFVLLASVLLLGVGMYFQHALRLHSCAPVVFVRYALVLIALLGLLALAISAAKLVRIVLSACIGLISLIGAVFAAHQSWPRHLPLQGAGLSLPFDSLVRSLPLAEVLPRYFAGFGECEKARWAILGITGSEWALVAFVLFLIAAAIAARRN